MRAPRDARCVRQQGQILVFFAVSALLICSMVGLVIDTGAGYRQARIQANAAAMAARAGTVYLSENEQTATDTQVECLVTLYASAAEYAQLVALGRCTPITTVPDNQGQVDLTTPVKGARGAWYVDYSGNELAAVGSVNSTLPVVGYLQTVDGYRVSGVRVYSAIDAATYFIRVAGIETIHVAASAAYRMGAVSTFIPGTPLDSSLPKPGGTVQNGIFTFPAAFSQQSFAAAGLQNPATTPPSQNFSANDGAAGFFWSSLQCQSNSNADTKAWLAPSDPCPAAGPAIAATGTATAQCPNGGPGPVTCISTQPGIRAVDYRLSDPYLGQVLIVPIVRDATNETQDSIAQFAYFYFTGYSARGANGYLSGYFIDPSLMPLLPGPIGSGSGPGGVGGI